ncbi:MAG: DegV family protein [Ruminococcaceae bacterium]|nr:DegV family protein [Oscillospiraceae bacterium]
MTIRISSDSTLDLSPELIDRYEVSVVSLTVSKDGKYYKDMLEIQPDEIFAHVAAGGDLCTTSAANVADYIEHFTELRKTCDAVIHVNLSADFSACYRNACLAAEEVDGVYVVDSRNLSTGHGLVVIEAANMVREGLAPDVIAERLRELTSRVEASFILDQLAYLKKGGRCSAVAAFGANLFNLKPCISVVNGKMDVTKKYRGSFEKCLREYVKDRLEGREDLVLDRIFVTHTAVADGIAELVIEEIKKYAPFAEILETTAGCTISCHCGPNTLGILFIHQ